MEKKHCCANEARFLRLLPQQQGRNEIRWRPGHEARLAPPCLNLRSFGSKCTVLKNVFVTLLGLYGAPHSDLAPPLRFGARGIVTPLPPPRYAPVQYGACSLWCKKGKAFCERAFALHHQQHGKDEQNIEFPHPAKVSADVHASDLNFIQNSGIFPTFFGCFLPANTTKKTSLNYRNFNKPFLCNIQSLET